MMVVDNNDIMIILMTMVVVDNYDYNNNFDVYYGNKVGVHGGVDDGSNDGVYGDCGGVGVVYDSGVGSDGYGDGGGMVMVVVW